MNIEEIRAARTCAENEIREILKKLQEETGMNVEALDVNTYGARYIDGARRVVIGAAEIKLVAP